MTKQLENNQNKKLVESSSQAKGSTHSSHQQLIKLAQYFGLLINHGADNKPLTKEQKSQLHQHKTQLLQQQNSERIINLCLEKCSETEVSDRIDPDWFSAFIQLTQTVFNKTMQQLWAEILYIETKQPGSFAIRTLKLFSEMSLTEAKLFAKACDLTIGTQQHHSLRIPTAVTYLGNLWNFYRKQHQLVPLQQFGLSYADCLTLMDIDLLHRQETEVVIDKHKPLLLYYQQNPLSFTTASNNKIISFYRLTNAATELYRITNLKMIDDYFALLQGL